MRTPHFLVVLSLLLAANAHAHPMGNFSINHYSRLEITHRAVQLLYAIDRAEIPTYQEIRQFGLIAKDNDPTIAPYLQTESNRLRSGLVLECDGVPVKLRPTASSLLFLSGAGGLPTVKVTITFRADLPVTSGPHRLTYQDTNFPGRAGWKEIILLPGEGVELRASDAPRTDRSRELTEYSADLLNSPPQQLSAEATFLTVPMAPPLVSHTHKPHPAPISAPVTPPAILKAPSAPLAPKALPVPTANTSTPRSRFTELISSQAPLSLWLLLSAALIAAGLGALHALEPGHGKTLVAAYLVGSRGTAKHAVLLGLIVTIAHTAGVFALGVVTLYLSRYIVPDHLYPWLGLISGLSVVAVGTVMLLRVITGFTGEHSHISGSPHGHGILSLIRSNQQSSEAPDTPVQTVRLRQLLALGISGGIVPCPAALVVLLSAFSLHRIGFGLFLITAFSFGLAAVLVAIGLLMVYAKRIVAARVQLRPALTSKLSLLSSALMVALGVGITWSALSTLHIPAFSRASLLPLISVVLLGLFLGIRHSTDSDHVVAVSTLVTRQGSIRGSAVIGLLWGLGHTVTIFLVGSAIIVFGVVIPPRLGLSMEFAVALMLILLGILSLTGRLQSITARWSPPISPEIPSKNTNGRSLGRFQTIRPLLVGAVHGLAGSAAVALLVLSTIHNPFWASAYLLVFGFGTVLGMMLMTTAFSLPLVYAKAKWSRFTEHFSVLSGLVSVAFGLLLAIQIGFGDGLFSSVVHWTPR